MRVGASAKTRRPKRTYIHTNIVLFFLPRIHQHFPCFFFFFHVARVRLSFLRHRGRFFHCFLLHYKETCSKKKETFYYYISQVHKYALVFIKKEKILRVRTHEVIRMVLFFFSCFLLLHDYHHRGSHCRNTQQGTECNQRDGPGGHTVRSENETIIIDPCTSLHTHACKNK